MSSIASTTCNSLGSELFLANSLPISKKRWEKQQNYKEFLLSFLPSFYMEGADPQPLPYP